MPDQDEDIFSLIGQFIVYFSQLEYSMRVILSESLQLPGSTFEAVTSSYDFRTLCAVTLVALKNTSTSSEDIKAAEQFVNAAKAVNDTRNRIVHGSWMWSEDGINARHMSRQSMIGREYFTNKSELFDALQRCREVLDFASRYYTLN